METGWANQASSSSSPSSIATQFKYDVFLSFSGVDTRKNFTSHLSAALERHGFHTFIDDKELKRGEYISDGLLKAIEESRISLVVLSKNYASSRWCLDELVKIMECRKKLQQIVFPIFHGVEPSDVRAQKGSLAEAFAKHEERFKEGSDGRVKKWREALTEVANLSGWDLPKVANGDEAYLIQKAVEEVQNNLNNVLLHVAWHEIGLESRLGKLKLLLKMETDDVRIVAIWGMAGIGKTTIAKKLYNLVQREFEGGTFLANISETSKQTNGSVVLQEQLLSDILRSGTHNLRNCHQGIEVIKRRAFCRKVLVILDDVDNVQQLKDLAIDRDSFGVGSRIIVTTRDISSLKFLKVDEIYAVEKLNEDESLELFRWHCFKEDHHTKDHLDLSNQVVRYAGGLPLALEVLGSFFCGKSIPQWRSAIAKLRTIPDDDVQGKLRISFDSLSKEVKELFLDMACFFVGTDQNFTVKILESCNIHAEIGIRVLADRCLVKYHPNRIVMHDLLRDMGREIVRQESIRDPGRRSRLWYHEDALGVLGDGTGTEAVEGLFLNFHEPNEVQVNSKAFEKMNRLWLLCLNYVRLRKGYEHISRRLKWLCWIGFPLKCLPSKLHMENLVTLDLRYSSLKKAWKGIEILVNLKLLYLSNCYHLIETPDFSGRHIVLLDQVEQSTKNVAHGVRADKCSPTVSLPEKKMMRKTWKRKCRTMNVVFESHQHFGRRCEGAAKRFRAKHICRKHGINQVSIMKRRKQHGIHQWPFRQKWATRKGYSLGDKRPYEVSSLSMDEKLDSRLLLIHMFKFARSSPRPLALPDGGEIIGPIALSSSECAATNNISHLVRQDQSGSTTSHYERKNTREMSQGITMSLFCEENLQQPFGCKHKDAVKRLDVNVSMFKGTCRQHRYYWWLCRIEKNEQEAFNATNNRARLVKADQSGLTMSTSEKEDTGEALKRECITKSILSLENPCQHYGVWFHTPDSNARKPFEERQELQFHTPDSLAWKSFEELNGLPLCKQSNCIRRVVPQRRLALKRWVRRKKSQDLPGMVQMNCSRGLTTQSASSLHGPIGLPDGGHNASLSKKKIVRKTFKRKCRAMIVSFEDHQQHFSCRCEGAVNSLGAKHICKQHGINLVATAKRIRGQHWIHRCPFRQSTFGLPDGGHILPLSEKKIVRKTLKRKCRSMSVLSLVERQQHVDRRWEDAAKNIGAKRICRQLVIHRVSIAKRICRQHGIHHQWPFQQDWATMKGYSLGDKRPVEVIRLSIDGKLVSRLRRIYISWLDRFSPRPSALPRGGLIVGPIALSSSEFAATNNLAQRVGQDQRGSGASGSENERTREQEDPEEIRTSITKNDLLQLHGTMTRKDAAAILHVSESTVKRKWKECKMGPWKNGGRRRVWKPPGQDGEGNTSTARETPSHNVQTGLEGEPVGQNQESNECRRDFMGHQIALNPESGLIMVPRPPDQHGERNTSTARETPSHNVQTGIEGVPVGQNQEANEFRPDFTGGSIHFNTGNGLIIGSSFGWASQVSDQLTLSPPYPNHDALGFPSPQIPSMPSENMGGSVDLRNSLASQVVSDGHISGYTNFTFATCSDQAGPSQHVQGQSMHPTVYPDHNVFPQTQIVSSQEPFSEGHVLGFSNGNEDTNFVMIKAFYGDGDNTIFKFPFPLTSGIVDLKKEVSKRLNVEVDRFVVKYKDKYEDLISILCNEDLMLYLWSSQGIDEIKVLVLDKVGGTPNFCEKCRSSMQTRA